MAKPRNTIDGIIHREGSRLLIEMLKEAMEDGFFKGDFSKKPNTIRVDLALEIGVRTKDSLTLEHGMALVLLAEMGDEEIMALYALATNSH